MKFLKSALSTQSTIRNGEKPRANPPFRCNRIHDSEIPSARLLSEKPFEIARRFVTEYGPDGGNSLAVNADWSPDTGMIAKERNSSHLYIIHDI
ncbi:MAG: hypothetical protein HY896_01065 [Deltaproteobacteria bacterium]|nr:hypothetical protein [Deltaproteobacteria bacterium]